MNTKEISKKLKIKAIDEGFAIAGIANIPGSSRITLRTKALDRWLDNNFHSEMKWMEADKRKNINLILDGAKSVLAVGYNYLSEKYGEWILYDPQFNKNTYLLWFLPLLLFLFGGTIVLKKLIKKR